MKAGLDHCVKMCDDLLLKVKQSAVEFMETRSSMDPLEIEEAKLMKSGMPQSIYCTVHTCDCQGLSDMKVGQGMYYTYT